jgi:predicted lipoprotein with Yx(FWY)xxD motif
MSTVVRSTLVLRRLVTGGVTLAVTVALAAGAATAAPAHTEVTTVKTSLGRVLAVSNGHVLYLFEKDSRNVSRCDKACRAYWPPVRSKGRAMAGTGVSASHLGLTRSGQVTYYGHPLYTYIGDTKARQANGEGSTEFGARWYVVSPKGRAVTG